MAEERGSRGNEHGRSYGNNNHRSGGNGHGGSHRPNGGHRSFRGHGNGGDNDNRRNNNHGRPSHNKFRRDDHAGQHRNGGSDRRFNRDDRNRNNQHDHNERHSSGERNFDRSKPRTGNKRYDSKRNDRFNRSDRRDYQDRRNRNERKDRNDRREFTQEEKAQYREQKRREYMSKSHRNSDGTVSFPSQNPYTDRRPGEPKMPKGIEWSMLSKEERERLRGLSKEHAENIGLHILAAYSLEESDPEAALAHAKWVAKQASRVDFAREVLAFVAYRQDQYKLALREFKTAKRMNGYLDYLPFIADCERGLGEPKKAIEVALSDEAKQLKGEAKTEMFLVYAGALADLEMWNQAIEVVAKLAHAKGLPGEYRMRALQAEQYFLDESGRSDEAVALDEIIDKFEERYADMEPDETDDDYVVDYDVEDLPEDLQAKLGVTEDDAQYAPFDGNDAGVNKDDETEDDQEEELSGAEMDVEPAELMERNERDYENGTEGDPDLDDENRDEAQLGDDEDEIQGEME
ncbi:helicase [Bifidobacterium dolichotidis]|uniref:Helicase n=1 Tax=Bifidobacterium dolichotidis TaxID=2306976 RepID=A0A430FTE5_9BIFI|nr:helicase [Bifidobacterium dolichotidis]RSX56131.1 helicase [Bifidobacterium dolichotidis]